MLGIQVLACVIATTAHRAAGVPARQLTAEGSGALPLSRQRHWASSDDAGPRGLPHVVEMLDSSSVDRQILGVIDEYWSASTEEKVSPSFWADARLRNFGNTQYIALTSVGTPEQNLTVLVDTGSSDLWYRASEFHVENSATAEVRRETMMLSYGQGTVNGSLVRDEFSLGPFSIHGQKLVVIGYSASMRTLAAAGLLGVGRPGLSHTGDTVLMNLQEQHNISVLCLVLSGTDTGSFLFFGDPDPSWAAGEVVWSPVVTPGYWAVQAEVDVVQEDVMMFLRGPIILDSGTSYIALPIPWAGTVLRFLVPGDALQRCKLLPAQLWQCPCDIAGELRHLDLVIAGARFRIPREEMLSKQPDGSCILELMAAPQSFPMIFGDTFLRTVVAVFDAGNQRIGIAPRVRPEVMGPAVSAPSGGRPVLGVDGDFVRVMATGIFSVFFLLLGIHQCALFFKTPTTAPRDPVPAAENVEHVDTPYQRVS